MIQLNQRPRLTDILLGVGVVVLIIGSLLPGNSAVMKAIGALPVSDKTLHGTAYFGLALVAAWARTRLRDAVIFATGLALLGAVLELAQNFVPGRTPEVMDEFANVCGILVGTILGRSIRSKPGPATLRS